MLPSMQVDELIAIYQPFKATPADYEGKMSTIVELEAKYMKFRIKYPTGFIGKKALMVRILYQSFFTIQFLF